jgi:predicted O-methyltransferase YrrM
MSKSFNELIKKIHLGTNPFEGYPKDQWPVQHWGGWGSDHPFFAEMVAKIKPHLIIEVGSFLGGSAIQQGQLLKKNGLNDSAVLCVDTWLAEQILWSLPDQREKLKLRFGRPCFYYTFLSNIIDVGLQNMVVPLSMPSLSAARYLKQLGVTAPMIYIDGCHEEFDCRRDLDMYWDLLEPGGGMIIDDYVCGSDMFAGLVRDVNRFVYDTHNDALNYDWFIPQHEGVQPQSITEVQLAFGLRSDKVWRETNKVVVWKV